MAKRKRKGPTPDPQDAAPPPEAPPTPPVAVVSPYDLAGSSARGAAAMRDLAERQGPPPATAQLAPLALSPTGGLE